MNNMGNMCYRGELHRQQCGKNKNVIVLEWMSEHER